MWHVASFTPMFGVAEISRAPLTQRPPVVRRAERRRLVRPVRRRRRLADEQGHRPGLSRYLDHDDRHRTQHRPGPPRREARAAGASCSPRSGWCSWSTRCGPAWAERDQVSGIVGLVSTVLFGACYLAVWHWAAAPDDTRCVERPPLAAAVAQLAVLIGLAVVMCLAIGQDGTAAAGLHRRRRRDAPAAPLPAAVLTLLDRRPRRRARRDRPGLGAGARPRPSPSAPRSFAVYGLQQVMLRNIALMQGPRGERPARGRGGAQPDGPRPARHPRPLADRDHGQGRAGRPAARRRPGARPGRARRPRAAEPRRAGRRTPAVEGYRDLTLPGELARARPALEAADIEAELPELAPTPCRATCASCSPGRSARGSPTWSGTAAPTAAR